MKAYDLKPTYENLLNTYKNDAIDRNKDICHFVNILNSIEGSFTIAIDGQWGSGKTFFVKQVKMVMDAHNKFINTEVDDNNEKIVSIYKRYAKGDDCNLLPQVCVYYDAWENDNDEDPVMSLVYTILKSVNTDFSFKEIDWLKAGASVIDAFSGMNWTQVVENLRSTSPLDALDAKKNIKEQVKDFLKSLLPEKGDRLVVFIDELDRCKPYYAVRLLERIKHYFDHDQITFVFSVNTNELQYTIKKHYGSNFDSSRYLDRFFDLRLSLPAPNMRKFYNSLEFDDKLYGYDIVCDAVIRKYHFGLREISKFINTTKIAAYNVMHGIQQASMEDKNAVEYCLCLMTPIMIGLKLSDIQRYNSFIHGRDSEALLEVLESLDIIGFDQLLANNETYYDDDANKTHVTRKEKLINLYDAIFGEERDKEQNKIRIGNLSIGKNVKNKLLRVDGLFSEYTDLNP